MGIYGHLDFIILTFARLFIASERLVNLTCKWAVERVKPVSCDPNEICLSNTYYDTRIVIGLRLLIVNFFKVVLPGVHESRGDLV